MGMVLHTSNSTTEGEGTGEGFKLETTHIYIVDVRLASTT